MAKLVAAKWLASEAKVEYRLTAYSSNPRMLKALPSLLRAYRDGRVRLGSTIPVTDLGIKDNGESVSIWTASAEGLVSVQNWLENHGYETTGVW
jgi:hypothetical protein